MMMSCAIICKTIENNKTNKINILLNRSTIMILFKLVANNNNRYNDCTYYTTRVILSLLYITTEIDNAYIINSIVYCIICKI